MSFNWNDLKNVDISYDTLKNLAENVGSRVKDDFVNGVSIKHLM